MSDVSLDIRCREIDADALFAVLADFDGHAQRAPSVRSVACYADADGRRVSEWEVHFRNGVLRWSEWDVVDPAQRTMRFVQRDGDPVHFEGSWRLTPAGDDCLVSFRATFDLGVATFAEVIDPIAEQALRDNILDLVDSVAPSGIAVIEAGDVG